MPKAIQLDDPIEMPWLSPDGNWGRRVTITLPDGVKANAAKFARSAEELLNEDVMAELWMACENRLLKWEAENA